MLQSSHEKGFNLIYSKGCIDINTVNDSLILPAIRDAKEADLIILSVGLDTCQVNKILCR